MIVLIALMFAGVRLLRLRTLRRLVPEASESELSPGQLELALRIGAIADAAYPFEWPKNRCLALSLATKVALARRGIASTLVLGFRRRGIADEFDVPDMRRDYAPHAWLETRAGLPIFPEGRHTYKVVGKLA